jgi:hypothetical protein
VNRPIIVTAATERLLAADRGSGAVGTTTGALVGGGVVGILVGLGTVGDRVGISEGGTQQLSDPTLSTVSQIASPVRYKESAAASPHVLIELLKSDGKASFSLMSNPSQNGQEFDGWTSEQQKAEKLISTFVVPFFPSHSASEAVATSASIPPHVWLRMLSGTKAALVSVIELEPPGHNEHCPETLPRRAKNASKVRDVFIFLYWIKRGKRIYDKFEE